MPTRVDRKGRLYVPKRAGAVRARWSRHKDVVTLILTDEPGGIYRPYIDVVPRALLGPSLRGRKGAVVIRFDRLPGGWTGSYKLIGWRGKC